MEEQTTKQTTNLIDGDYRLVDGSAWLSAGGFSMRVTTTSDGIIVDLYKQGEELAGVLTSAMAFNS